MLGIWVLESLLKVGFLVSKQKGKEGIYFLDFFLEFPDSGTAVGADERQPTRRPPAGIWKTRWLFWVRMSVLRVHEEHEEHFECFQRIFGGRF